jgi:diacylglycerol kinase family enzyme
MMYENRKIAILLNPLAGSGRATAMAGRLCRKLEEKQVVFYLFDSVWPVGLDAYSDIWIVGGDGTLNFFVNKYRQLQQPLVIFGAGSGNDFHWLLYGKKDEAAMLATALDGEVQQVDAGLCNGRLFMNGIGIGFDGAIAHALSGKNKRVGKSSFMLAVLKKILFYQEHSFMIDSGTGNRKQAYLMINIMNGQRAGGGFYVAPGAHPSDGWLDFNGVTPLSRWQRLRYLPVIEKGKHPGMPCIEYSRVKHVKITATQLVEAHLDGEYFSAASFEITLQPGAFTFRI